MKKLITVLLIAGMVLILHSCYYDKEQLLTPPKTANGPCAVYSFATDINPIIQSSCNNGSGCHGAGSSNGPGELVNYNEIRNAVSQIQSSVLAGRMPLGSSLSADQVKAIDCWTKNGAPNN
ncbi:MAG: hypothetical protein JST87_03900 [Bacteroidetes bacterium]|nr:hypothetical protein [Bacteroidota bacterium]MBS1932457.1 hypothetical protein [Bacteroidota bacterium]